MNKNKEIKTKSTTDAPVKKKSTARAVTKADKEPKARKAAKTTRAAKQNLAPHKLLLLVTVVPRSKAEFYLDLLQSFEVNLQLEVSAFGTAGSAFGFLDGALEKQALFSVIREDNAPKALQALEDKFNSLRGGKGIAFTVPFTSMVGVMSYQFLSNKQK
ncbi:MAG: hypothetical protein J1G02_05950 [Clostridiales bacterium]|nr:hypothetical protein [Clostridiales bacterium]